MDRTASVTNPGATTVVYPKELSLATVPPLPESFDDALLRDPTLSDISPKDWQPKMWCGPCVRGKTFGFAYPSYCMWKRGRWMCLVCTEPFEYTPEAYQDNLRIANEAIRLELMPPRAADLDDESLEKALQIAIDRWGVADASALAAANPEAARIGQEFFSNAENIPIPKPGAASSYTRAAAAAERNRTMSPGKAKRLAKRSRKSRSRDPPKTRPPPPATWVAKAPGPRHW